MLYKVKSFFRSFILTKKLYYFLYVLKDQKKRNGLKENSFTITRSIFDAFENNNIEYFYSFGNMLGLIREGKFISHDNDIDIVVPVVNDSIVRELPDLIEPYGFNLVRYFTFNDMVTEYTFSYKNTGLTIDVFFGFKDSGKLVKYFYCQKENVKYKNADEMSAFTSTSDDVEGYFYKEAYGNKLKLPINYENMLYASYGPNWMIKDKKYDGKKAPGCTDLNKLGYRHMV